MSHSALKQGLLCCTQCHKTLPRSYDGRPCPRCGTRVHQRRPHSITYSWALLISAAFALIPAYMLPIMTLKSLGQGAPSTIIGGVIDLIEYDMLGIAFVVLTASVIIPLIKVAGMVILLLTVQRGVVTNLHQKMLMYRFVEWIGRWSMLDIFVVAILAAIVQLGNLASINGEVGATAFGAAVILTMLSATVFDTRLIWDKHLQQLEESQ